MSAANGSRASAAAGSPWGQAPGRSPKDQPTLDEIINESIQRARDMGYSLQQLRERVRQRLLAQPPDHILVVEEELGLRKLICREIRESIGWAVEDCSLQEFEDEPGLAIGAQVIAPNHVIGKLKAHIPETQPAVPVIYSRADEHLNTINSLKDPSIIAVASFSESLLKTARSLLAVAVARKHVFQEFLISKGDRLELKGVDLVFCDTIAMQLISCGQKFRYRLIDPDCIEHLASVLDKEATRLQIPESSILSPPAAPRTTP